MGVSFSQAGVAGVALAEVPAPHCTTTQRLSPASSPLPASSVGPSDTADVLCSASDRVADFLSTGEAALPAATSTRTAGKPANDGTRNSTPGPSTSGSALAQHIQQSLRALALDWTVVDREISSITVRFATALLTSRLRLQRGSGGGNAHDDDDGDSAAAAAAAGDIHFEESRDDEESVGPQEVYVSAVLRLAALQLGPDGLQRVVAALAFLADGGESREERRLRRHASLPTANTTTTAPGSAMRRVGSSFQEINHFQRGAGFTRSAAAATGGPSSATSNGNAAGTAAGAATCALNATGSALPSIASYGSVFASRRFSTAPHPQVQQASANMYLISSGGAAVAANWNANSNNNGNVKLNTNVSTDNFSYSSPVRGGAPGGSLGAAGGHGYPHMLRQPSSSRSLDEAASLLGANALSTRHRSVSPLNATSTTPIAGHGHSLRHRAPTEPDLLAEDYSYNNTLLMSMNARSTLLSPLRTGIHGDHLYSSSSLATLISLSTGVGAHTGRSHRGVGHDVGSVSALRSPVSPFLHPATQWVIPPAPFGTPLTSTGGVMSANSSIPNSFSSAASPTNAPDSRRRSEPHSRRLVQPLSPYQISRLSVVEAGAMLSQPASAEANQNMLLYHLPPAVDGGGGGGGAEGGTTLPLAPGLRDTALKFLRPEAVLAALCCVFAHVHLSVSDVVNLVTLLVVAALEVQTEAQLRRLVEAKEEVSVEDLRTPSMTQVRAAVHASLALVLIPLYRRTRMSICAAAGAMDATAQAALLASSGSCAGGEAAGSGSSRQQSPLRPAVHAVDLHSSGVHLPPVDSLNLRHQQQQQQPRSGRHRSFPPSPLPDTPLRSGGSGAAEDITHSDGHTRCTLTKTDLAVNVKAVHDFFESSLPLESTPSLWRATSTTATARAMAARRHPSPTASADAAPAPPSVPRGSSSRHQPPPPHQALTKAASSALYAHQSYSDSAAGPTSCGSMPRSGITDAVANLMSSFPVQRDAGFTPPLQEEMRLANSLLMDVETAFVLHYAEVVPEAENSKRHTTAAPTGTVAAVSASVPPFPSSLRQRLRQSTGGLGKRPALHTPSTPTVSTANTTAAWPPPSGTGSLKDYPWRRRSDGDPDLFVQLSSNATVWPLRTRFLVRRHEYAYVYDAMASTMVLLRDENLYTCEGIASAATATSDQQQQPCSRVPHPHTPIALIDLSTAGVERGVYDLQVLSGPGDVEIVSLMPSRVTRSTLVSQTHRAASTGATPLTATTTAAAVSSADESAATASASQTSTPNSASFHGRQPAHHIANCNTTARVGSHGFDDLLGLCWADAYQNETEVYRMKGSTGAMYLLTVPAEAERAMVPVAAGTSAWAVHDASNGIGGAPTEEAVRTSVIHSFERNRLIRPAVLSLASKTTSPSNEAPVKETEGLVAHHHAEDTSGNGFNAASTAGAPVGKDPRVQCAYNDTNREVLSLELGSEPTRIAAYPLRLLYHGILHHFFFPNPSARDHWYQQLLQLSWMTQSRAHLDTVAAAPHNVARFLRNRISFPTGPGAFDCLDMLGAGTFGRVLLVQHKLSKRLFAMKVIRKSGFHGIRNVIEARREKKILDQLDCPYVMKVHSSFQTDSRVYMVFDYLPGAELLLHTQSAHSHHFDETTSRFYIAELAIAVEYLRVRGIVHRDIKGDNLVLDAEGHVVLTDFGFAKNILAFSTAAASQEAGTGALPQVIRQHTSCGTLAYIAPEVLSNSRRHSGYGLAVDWWSLGVVLFTFLTGYFPFLKQTGPETSQAIVSSTLQFPPRPALSEEARNLLEQLLQKDPDKRTACLADLRHHRFFDGFDWTACCERRLPPPLVLHKDSYRSPRTTADARQLLQDRVRRSLAWSSGQSEQPYIAPSHSRRSTSDKLTIKLQPQLLEEQAELRLVERAYGSDCMPEPLSSFNDVFGPLFEQQERCGTDRDESDNDDLGMEDYIAPLARPTLDALRRLKECGASLELGSSSSGTSLASAGPDGGYEGQLGEERGGRHGRAVAMPSLPALVDFSEDLYADLALAKYHLAAA